MVFSGVIEVEPVSIRRGKRRRRERRHRDSESVGEATPVVQEQPAPRAPRRGPKPLAQRSPLFPAGVAVLCLVGAVFTAVTNRSGSFPLVIAVVYLGLGVVEGFIAYRIYRARGG